MDMKFKDIYIKSYVNLSVAFIYKYIIELVNNIYNFKISYFKLEMTWLYITYKRNI